MVLFHRNVIVFKIPFIRIILKPLSLKDKLLSGATLPRFFKMKLVGMSETFVCYVFQRFHILHWTKECHSYSKRSQIQSSKVVLFISFHKTILWLENLALSVWIAYILGELGESSHVCYIWWVTRDYDIGFSVAEIVYYHENARREFSFMNKSLKVKLSVSHYTVISFAREKKKKYICA